VKTYSFFISQYFRHSN